MGWYGHNQSMRLADQGHEKLNYVKAARKALGVVDNWAVLAKF